MDLRLTQYDHFWIHYLGVTQSGWDSPAVSVSAHVGLEGYRGVWFFIRKERLVISAPHQWVRHIRQSLPIVELHATNIEVSKLQLLFGESFDRCIGPVFQGSLTAERFTPFESTNVRELIPQDCESVDAFLAECPAEDFSVSGIDKTGHYRTAFFDHGRIVAIAGYRRGVKRPATAAC